MGRVTLRVARTYPINHATEESPASSPDSTPVDLMSQIMSSTLVDLMSQIMSADSFGMKMVRILCCSETIPGTGKSLFWRDKVPVSPQTSQILASALPRQISDGYDI